MKKYILLFALASTFFACETIETNTPAFQANLDNTFFESFDARGIVGENDRTSFLGANADQMITIELENYRPGLYELTVGGANRAIYEDPSGQIYTTDSIGGGFVDLNFWDTTSQTVGGNFTFDVVLQGLDTIRINKGILFRVPYGSGTTEDPTDPSNPDGTFVAEIDGQLFEPSTIVATTTDVSIIINAALGDDTIQLVIPLDATEGTNAIPGNGYTASYFVAGDEEMAQSGSIRVFTHDMAAQTISGTFNFMTENHQISLGQYNISY